MRVELNPTALFNYGIGLEDIRAALASANANSPKGAIEDKGVHYQIYTNDQASKAADYMPLIVGYRNGNAVHLSDLGEIDDSVEDFAQRRPGKRSAFGARHSVSSAGREHYRHG